jgi:glycine cleavage system regulatory protein
MELELVGLDRPGLVREISQLLAQHAVNVEELVTDRSSAPMSGEMLFRARARVHVPADANLPQLRAGLERLANDLLVEIRLADSAGKT